MSTNLAIVDDRDVSIRYSGVWSDAGDASEYASTTRWSTRSGSTASFSFIGTSVTVYGSIAPNATSAAKLAFAIEGTTHAGEFSPKNSSTVVRQEPLWTSPALGSGPHTLVITQAVGLAGDGPVFLDYLMYAATAESTGVTSYFVDDRDPPHQIHRNGDSFSFTFEGTSVAFYGGIGQTDNAQDLFNASIVLDGAPPVFYVPPANISSPTTNNLIFQSGILDFSNHTLTVTAENERSVGVDYFLIGPGRAPPTTPASPSSSDRSTVSPPSSAAQKSTPVGAVAAAVVGAVVLVALVIGAIFFMRRRKRLVADAELAAEPFPPFLPASTSEYLASSPTSSGHGGTASISLSSSVLAPSKRGYQPYRPQIEVVEQSAHAASSSSITSGGSPDALRPPMVPISSKLAREDQRRAGHGAEPASGLSRSDGREELPPTYSE
ncbi:hypothetical protein C8J57DRAFT_1521102 [Mycena rebaudengoi]|nr:hypothetical protein C8J57DRAFT_1521102 [Mycena rebaudengoi]